MFFFAVTPLVLLLGVAEVVVRLTGAAETCTAVRKSVLWVCDPILHFRTNPDLLVDGKPINSRGFRGAELRPKDKRVYRIVALGDSCTFGFVVTTRGAGLLPEAYPERLGRILAERHGPAKVEVLNAGVPGYNSYHGVMLLRTKLRDVEADLVTVRYGWNDLMSSGDMAAGSAFVEPTSAVARVLEGLLLRTALYPFGLRLGMDLSARLASDQRPPNQPPAEWQPNVPLLGYKHNLRRIVELVQARGARVWLLTSPDAFMTAEFETQYGAFAESASSQLAQLAWSGIRSFKQLHELRESYNAATREVGAELGVPVIDVAGSYRFGRPFAPVDAIHPNAAGHEVEAELLYQQLRARGDRPTRVAVSRVALVSVLPSGPTGTGESPLPSRAELASQPAAPSFYVEIFTVCLAAILLEISYTRIISFKLYYYFTYLIIGLALLGLGSGGVIVAVFARLRSAAASHVVSCSALAGSATIALGYIVVARMQLNAFDLAVGYKELLKLVIISSALFTPFLAAGIIIATIFTARPARIHRLYATDLVGAGLGCALAVPLISVIGPPGTVVLAGLLYALAGVHSAPRGNTRRVGWGMVAALTVLVALHRQLPDPVPDRVKTLGMKGGAAYGPSVFSSWSTVFRIDVTENSLVPGSSYLIHHDGNLGSVLHRFNGDLSTLTRFDTDPRSLPFQVTKPAPHVLIIGAAGGHEILTSRYFGARHITAVELNPATVSLLTDRFADYTGHIAAHERVTLVNAEGRSYLQRTDDSYDLIWFVAPDSYAAMNAATSGAFVLSESYLYTIEMIQEALSHLAEGGVICVMFGELAYDRKPNRTARYLATAREAFRRIGIADFDRHVIVTTKPDIVYLSTILLKKEPFTDNEVRQLLRGAERVPESVVRHAPGNPPRGDGPVERAIFLAREQLSHSYDSYPYYIDPVTDDAPFFWHFTRFRDALSSTAAREARGVYVDIDDVIGERLIVVLLAFATVFAAVWLFLPFVVLGRAWRSLPYKTSTLLYFAALGVGFMQFEVSLIQMLTLFLGYPSYSLSVTLFGLLTASGLGSLASGAYRGKRDRALIVLLASLFVLMLFYRFGLEFLVHRFAGAALPLRCVLAILLITPLGLCLGAFMPLGLATVAGAAGTHRDEFVAWAWAVNGFFSVISSVASTILAMAVGFNLLLLIAVGVYAVGVVALSRLPPPPVAA